MLFRVPTVVGVIAFCVAVSMLVTTVDNRIFRRGKKIPNAAPASTSTPAGDSANITAFEPVDIQDQHWKANELLTKADSEVQEALRLCNTWPEVMEGLKKSDSAEAIAVEKELVDKIAFLDRQERVSADDIRSHAVRVSGFRQRVDELSRLSTPRQLSAREMAGIRELQLVTASARSVWSDAHEQAKAIERVAIQKMMPKRERNLEEEMQNATDQSLLDDIEQRQEVAKEEEAERRAREKELAEKRRIEELARLELVKRATSTEVTSLLAPFLHPRDVQPRMSGGSMRLRKTIAEQPISLSSLQAIGALNPDIDGLKRLAKAGGDRKLSEPRWAVYSQPGNWSDGDMQMLKDAQQALIEFGPTLVELGMLSP